MLSSRQATKFHLWICAWWIFWVRLYLDCQDYVRTQILSRKINQSKSVWCRCFEREEKARGRWKHCWRRPSWYTITSGVEAYLLWVGDAVCAVGHSISPLRGLFLCYFTVFCFFRRILIASLVVLESCSVSSLPITLILLLPRWHRCLITHYFSCFNFSDTISTAVIILNFATATSQFMRFHLSGRIPPSGYRLSFLKLFMAMCSVLLLSRQLIPDVFLIAASQENLLVFSPLTTWSNAIKPT